MHRAGAEHGLGLDARIATAGLDRASRSFTPERRLWPTSARFRSCQAWPEQELYSFMCRYIYLHMKPIKTFSKLTERRGTRIQTIRQSLSWYVYQLNWAIIKSAERSKA